MQLLNPATIETTLIHAEKYPITVGFFVLVGLFAAGLYWLLFRFWPQWREEQDKHHAEAEKTRLHMSELLKQRGNEAAEDIARERELARVQHEATVREISGAVERLDARVSGVHDIVKSIASKIGAAIVLLFIGGR